MCVSPDDCCRTPGLATAGGSEIALQCPVGMPTSHQPRHRGSETQLLCHTPRHPSEVQPRWSPPARRAWQSAWTARLTSPATAAAVRMSAHRLRRSCRKSARCASARQPPRHPRCGTLRRPPRLRALQTRSVPPGVTQLRSADALMCATDHRDAHKHSSSAAALMHWSQSHSSTRLHLRTQGCSAFGATSCLNGSASQENEADAPSREASARREPLQELPMPIRGAGNILRRTIGGGAAAAAATATLLRTTSSKLQGKLVSRCRPLHV